MYAKNMIPDEKEIEKAFWSEWEKSIAARLLIPDKDTVLITGKSLGNRSTIAIGAFENGSLGRLDYLFETFKIEREATSEFKGDLRENWMNGAENKMRNTQNNTSAAIAELAVADYIKNSNCLVKELSAWRDRVPDITFSRDNIDYYVEVKYFDVSPEIDQSCINSAKGENSSTSWSTDQTLNFFCSRIAEATIQLEDYPLEQREVFLVFDESAQKIAGRDDFERYIYDMSDWVRLNKAEWDYEEDKCYSSGDVFYPGVPKSKGKDVIGRTPAEWFKEAKIFVATMNRFSLENVKQVF